MRMFAIAALSLAAGIASADVGDVVQVPSLQVMERMQVLELINVTAEKPPADDVEPLEHELQAILDEASDLESDETAEDR